jgi:hypothetical protein
VHGLPIRFVVRFTALPAVGAWEATLLAQPPTPDTQPLASAAGASPADALGKLLAQPIPPLSGRVAPEPAATPAR